MKSRQLKNQEVKRQDSQAYIETISDLTLQLHRSESQCKHLSETLTMKQKEYSKLVEDNHSLEEQSVWNLKKGIAIGLFIGAILFLGISVFLR